MSYNRFHHVLRLKFPTNKLALVWSYFKIKTIVEVIGFRKCPHCSSSSIFLVLLHTQVPPRLEWFTQQCSGHKGVLWSQERYPLFMLLQSRQPIWRCHFHKKAWPNGYLPLFMLAFTDFARWCPDCWHGEINTVLVPTVWKVQHCAQRWDRCQSPFYGTASVQTVDCGEEQRKEQGGLKMVAKLKSWSSDPGHFYTWGSVCLLAN